MSVEIYIKYIFYVENLLMHIPSRWNKSMLRGKLGLATHIAPLNFLRLLVVVTCYWHTVGWIREKIPFSLFVKFKNPCSVVTKSFLQKKSALRWKWNLFDDPAHCAMVVTGGFAWFFVWGRELFLFTKERGEPTAP